MIKLIAFVLLLGLYPLFASWGGEEPYCLDRRYSVVQLQADFNDMRSVFEAQHPRPYEFTPKETFDAYFDSLYTSINREMTEREFQFVMAQIIAKIHCAHTKLYPSRYLSAHFNDYFDAPAFRLFYKDGRAYLRNNYSLDTMIHLGAEILSVNGVSVKAITQNFIGRIHNEGRNKTFSYNRMNTGMYGLFPGICDYPPIPAYQLEYINPQSTTVSTGLLPSMPFNDYERLIGKDKKQDLEFYMVDSLSTGVLSVSTFKIGPQTDTYFRRFIAKSFETLKKKKAQNLIVDLRGNIGGWPVNGDALLRYMMKTPFAFFDSTSFGSDEFKTPIPLYENRFTGNLYFLADGAGRSCTGMVLSFVKYYKLGPIIGEESCTSPSTNANNEEYVLPNTKLVFVCSRNIYQGPMKDAFVRGRGIMPDIEIDETIDDFIAGKDRYMDVALSLIKSN